MGLQRAQRDDAAGTDPGQRCGALCGRLASLDAVEKVGLVSERRPAGRRVARDSWARGGWAACYVLAGSRQGVQNAVLGA